MRQFDSSIGDCEVYIFAARCPPSPPPSFSRYYFNLYFPRSQPCTLPEIVALAVLLARYHYASAIAVSLYIDEKIFAFRPDRDLMMSRDKGRKIWRYKRWIVAALRVIYDSPVECSRSLLQKNVLLMARRFLMYSSIIIYDIPQVVSELFDSRVWDTFYRSQNAYRQNYKKIQYPKVKNSRLSIIKMYLFLLFLRLRIRRYRAKMQRMTSSGLHYFGKGTAARG